MKKRLKVYEENSGEGAASVSIQLIQAILVYIMIPLFTIALFVLIFIILVFQKDIRLPFKDAGREDRRYTRTDYLLVAGLFLLLILLTFISRRKGYE
jgi:hypothetical protein